MTSHCRTWSAVAAAVGCWITAAPGQSVAQEAAPPAARAVAPDPIPDPELTSAVERRLARNPVVPYHRIDVESEAGVVTLTGPVGSLLAARQAVAVARETRGVRSVVNRLVIQGADRTDDQVRRAVETALAGDPATEAYEVKTVVRDGVATLTGTVDSWPERRLAGLVASGVVGVTRVENNIRVDAPEQRVDAEIVAEVRRRLRWDVRVDGRLIDVAAENGIVTLTGTVGSAAERRQAYYDAFVPGVTAVNVEKLIVDSWWDRDRLRRPEKAAKPADAAIRQAVLDAFRFDPRLRAAKLTVLVTDGVVSLGGVVNNLASKMAARRDTWNTVGVRGVRNYIKVRPAGEVTDADIVRGIEAAFLADPGVQHGEIEVTARNGRVQLTGTVDSLYERNRATEVASRVPGVTDVRNHLSLGQSSAVVTRQPDGSPDDAAIRDDIKDQLLWSPFVDAEEIEVEVHGGVATLTGTVDTWGERQAAGENAREAGAITVLNHVVVKPGADDAGR